MHVEGEIGQRAKFLQIPSSRPSKHSGQRSGDFEFHIFEDILHKKWFHRGQEVVHCILRSVDTSQQYTIIKYGTNLYVPKAIKKIQLNDV